MYKYTPRETEKKSSVFLKIENISKLKTNKKNKTINYKNRSKNNEKNYNIKINNNNMNNSFY